MEEKKKVDILGVKIANVTSSELNDEIGLLVQNGVKCQILHANIHGINIAYSNKWYKETLNNSHITFCDGDGVRLGAKILGKDIREKITYNRWIWELALFSEKRSLSWYLVGSENHVIQRAKEVLIKKNPDLKILGAHHGFVREVEINQRLVEDIKAKSPNILIVGMGMPLQEKWLNDNFNDLSFNVALTGGAVFEYVSGIAKMTPNSFYRLKLEWFYRFMQEPRRLFKRYFIGNPVFIIRILRQKYFG